MPLSIPYKVNGDIVAGSTRLGSRMIVAGDGSEECLHAFIGRFHDDLYDAVHTHDSSALFIEFDGTHARYEPRDPERVFLTKTTVEDRNKFTLNSIWHRDLKETNIVGFPKLQESDSRMVVPTLVADSDESVDEAFRGVYAEPVFYSNPIRQFDVNLGWIYARGNLGARFGLTQEILKRGVVDESVKILLNFFFLRMYEVLSPDHCCSIGDRSGGLLVMDTNKLPHAKMPIHRPAVAAAPYVTATMWKKGH